MFTYLLLYVLPLTARFALTDTFEATRIILSLIPLVVVFPSTLLPRFINNEETEHVLRHAIYALAFTISVGTAIKWDIVADLYSDEDWPLQLILFCSVGSVTLWWFVISHIIENSNKFFFTHQGDVTVLPLTLVAIATFVYDVPDDAFQFSRCILFYVPIIVAWATMHFEAFNEFAVSKTTTHTKKGFAFLAHSGLIVAIAHLTLIEIRAKPVSFIFLPLVASVLSQVTFRHTSPPVLRANRLVGMWGIQIGLCIAFGILLKYRFDSNRVIFLNALIGMAVVMSVPALCGDRWVVPSVLYATLVSVSYVDADDRIQPHIRIFDIIAIVAQFVITFQVTHLMAPPEEIQLEPPGPAPRNENNTPQKNASPLSITSLLRVLDYIPIPYCRLHGEETVRDMMENKNSSCPVEFSGIWWTKGSTFPMQLVTVHGHLWKREDNVWKSTFSLRTGTRSATVAGLLNLLGQTPCVTQVQWTSGDRWVRTTGWVLPILRLLPDTYWLYRVMEDEMLRVVFNSKGEVVWQYRMLRIVRGDEHKTKYYNEFMSEYKDVSHILG
jgi:hypothetical protein